MTILLTRPRGTAVVAPPSRRTVRAASASAVSAVLGFVPLHLVWALGVPLWADPARFDAWHRDGGGAYLYTLSALALLPALLAVALVHPRGLRVHRLLLIVPGVAVSALLFAYTAFAAVLAPVQWGDPAAIFEPGLVLYGIPQFLVWAGGLAVATRSYARRTAAAGS